MATALCRTCSRINKIETATKAWEETIHYRITTTHTDVAQPPRTSPDMIRRYWWRWRSYRFGDLASASCISWLTSSALFSGRTLRNPIPIAEHKEYNADTPMRVKVCSDVYPSMYDDPGEINVYWRDLWIHEKELHRDSPSLDIPVVPFLHWSPILLRWSTTRSPKQHANVEDDRITSSW